LDPAVFPYRAANLATYDRGRGGKQGNDHLHGVDDESHDG
jgi:hypothetical protein